LYATQAILNFQEAIVITPRDETSMTMTQLSPDEDHKKKVLNMLMIAYYNNGQEESHLANYDSALINYEKSLKICERHFPANLKLSSMITDGIELVRSVLRVMARA
jgi:tetratricopeptide (TPR) repeat protein